MLMCCKAMQTREQTVTLFIEILSRSDKFCLTKEYHEHVLGNEGCNCSKMVFDHSFWHPEVTAGVLREESLSVLRDYFGTHIKK